MIKLNLEIPDSFVFNTIKYKKDKPSSGEAKLYVGPKNNKQELYDFFESNKITFSKENLQTYLDQTKLIYEYKLFGEYEKADLNYWKEMDSVVKNLDTEIIIDKKIEIVLSKDRYYIRVQDEMFKNFRKIALPIITELEILKVDSENKLIFNLKLKEGLEDRIKKDFDSINSLFSNYLTSVNQVKFSRNRIVYGAPGTGKSYKLNEEVKDFSKLITQEKEQNDSMISKPNYWIATCGENNNLWDDFVKDKVYAVGWDELGDLKQYKDKKEIEEKLEKLGNPNKSGSNQWNIGHLLKEGDIIAVRKGIKGQLEAYGTVDGKYKYDSTRDSFKHTISIKWEKIETMKLSTYNINFPIQSLVEMNSELKKSFKEEYLSKDTSEEFETKPMSTASRVTFYDGYTHGQFVGTYKPVPNGEGVSYKYVAGPFIKQLIEAIRNPNDKYCLVIEEINRARADKVFGNIFQLLDRDTSGKSQYPIELSEDQLGYFTEKLENEHSEKLKKIIENGLYIPSNLYIWATMNSADQGVYPLDSAFKRRWNFEHIGLDDNEEKFKDGSKKLGILYEIEESGFFKAIEWNDFRKVINKKLLDEGIQEDRLIAPFFINPKQFIREDGLGDYNENSGEGYIKDLYELEPRIYMDKVIMYLFEDVLRHKKKSILFNESYKSFSQLKKDYKEKIENNEEFSIFDNEIRNELRKFKIQGSEVVEKEVE